MRKSEGRRNVERGERGKKGRKQRERKRKRVREKTIEKIRSLKTKKTKNKKKDRWGNVVHFQKENKKKTVYNNKKEGVGKTVKRGYE